MDKREQYIIQSLEKLNQEISIIEQNSTTTKVIKKLFNIKNIKKKMKRLSIRIKSKIFKVSITPNVNNDMEYTPYEGDKKIVVYTCITGGYDNLLEPYYLDEKCDYVVFTDSNIKSNIYKVLDIPEKVKKLENNILINRYIKLNPHELFGQEYDYSIYIDGNIRPISNLSAFINNINDEVGVSIHKHSIRNCIYEEEKALKVFKKGNYKLIQKQINEYKKEGFPEKYGMVEACVIVTDLKKDTSRTILIQWWEEFVKRKSMRDQLAIPYVLWKNNIKMEKVATLGNNVFKNPKIKRVEHI